MNSTINNEKNLNFDYIKLNNSVGSSTVNNIIVAILMLSIIAGVILIYIFRIKLFGPKDLSDYGTMSDFVTSNCIVPNKSEQDIRCSDVGEQVSVSKCVQNPATGYYCYDGKKQVSTTKVRANSCIPPCKSFIWENIDISPCLINETPDAGANDVISLSNPQTNWCNPRNKVGVRVKKFKCNPHDGSGPNTCNFLCNSDVYNPDCNGNNIVLHYDPTSNVTGEESQLTEVSPGNYEFKSVSRADDNFPLIPAKNMETTENCLDLEGYTCGQWIDSTNEVNGALSANCIVLSNIQNDGTIIPNTENDLYSAGIELVDLDCTDFNGNTDDVRCEPNNDCIKLEDLESTILSSSGLAIPNICAEYKRDENNNITEIITPEKIVKTCLYMDPSLSVGSWAGNTDFIYSDPTDTFSPFKGIISVPLFIETDNSFLSVYNTPCPTLTSVNNSGVLAYNFDQPAEFEGIHKFDGDVDIKPPDHGITFRFDCKGNSNVQLAKTPCTMVPIVNTPSVEWGISTECDINVNSVSPVTEQTALMVFIKPKSIDQGGPGGTSRLLCNIFGVFKSSDIGWLTWGQIDTVPGYQWTDGSNIGLIWNQGKLTNLSNRPIPGTNIDDLGVNGEFYINLASGFDPLLPSYSLMSQTNIPLTTIGATNPGDPISQLDNFKFVPASIASESVITSLSNSEVQFIDEKISKLLYARNNLGLIGDGLTDVVEPVHKCNIMIE